MNETTDIPMVDYTEQLLDILTRLDSSIEYMELIQYSISSIYTAQLFVIGVVVSLFVVYFLYRAIKQLF